MRKFATRTASFLQAAALHSKFHRRFILDLGRKLFRIDGIFNAAGKTMKFTLKTLIWSTLLVAIVLVGTFAIFPKPLEVEVAMARVGQLKITVQEDGKTRIREKYTVSAPVAGRLSRIELDAGDRCDESTLLAVILPSNPAILDARAQAEANARVQAAEASLERAKSNEVQAQINHDLNTTKYERAQKLLPSESISQDEFDVIRTNYQGSAQAIKTASFEAEIASFELAMAAAAVKQFDEVTNNEVISNRPLDNIGSAAPFEIFAPITGRILRVFEESSTVVTVGTALLEIGDPQNLEIEIDVLSTDAVRIKPGAEIKVEHWGGEAPLHGNVRVIEPAAFTKVSSLGVEEQRVNIIADFNELPERLQSLGDGYRVEASITIGDVANVLLIPNSALFRHEREWHVLSIVDGRAKLQRVSVGRQNDTESEIVDGLVAGDPVIVYPNDSLAPGAKVKFSNGNQAGQSMSARQPN